MSEHIAKHDLTEALAGLRDALEASFRTEVRDLASHFNHSQGAQNQRFDRIDASIDEMDTKLSAIMEMLTTRQEVRALVRELKAQGIKLDETRIFAA